MTTKPEALNLADWLDAVSTGLSANRAAAELRRLHTENEALKSREPPMIGRPLSMLGMPARIESLEAENESLRKALESEKELRRIGDSIAQIEIRRLNGIIDVLNAIEAE